MLTRISGLAPSVGLLVAAMTCGGCGQQDDSKLDLDGGVDSDFADEIDSASDKEIGNANIAGVDLPLQLPTDVHPVRVWVLEDGTEVTVPAYFESTGGVMIVGTADLDALWKLQRGMDAYEPLNASGKGICFVWLFEYSSESDLDAYKEVAFTHLANPKGSSSDLEVDISSFEGVMAVIAGLPIMNVVNTALWLDSDVGIAAGEQIWGHPKLKAQFSGTSEWRGGVEVRREVTVTETLSGRQVVYADLSFPEERLPGLSLSPQQAVTTGTWGDKNGPHKFETSFDSVESVAMKAWDNTLDQLILGHGTPQLDMLQELEFEPLGMMYYGSFELLLGPPATP